MPVRSSHDGPSFAPPRRARPLRPLRGGSQRRLPGERVSAGVRPAWVASVDANRRERHRPRSSCALQPSRSPLPERAAMKRVRLGAHTRPFRRSPHLSPFSLHHQLRRPPLLHLRHAGRIRPRKPRRGDLGRRLPVLLHAGRGRGGDAHLRRPRPFRRPGGLRLPAAAPRPHPGLPGQRGGQIRARKSDAPAAVGDAAAAFTAG